MPAGYWQHYAKPPGRPRPGGGGGGGNDDQQQTIEPDMIQESGETGGAAGPGGAAVHGGAAGAGGGAAVAGGAAAPGGGAAGAGGGSAQAGGARGAAATQGASGARAQEAGAPQAGAGAAAGAATRAPAAPLYIMGPHVLWYFNGETPPGYDVSKALRSNRTGGTFQWSCSAQLTLSSPTGATTLVTSAAASSSVRDAWIRLRHTAADGTATAASYRLTIKAPTSLRHLRNDDRASATWVYETFIHYSILDQFAAVLPRNVPINENWTGAVVPDIPGMNWRRGDPGGAMVGPADWNDWVGGERPGHIPEPVAPGHADAAPLVYHWPGTWQVGSEAVGRGRQVAAVTWSKHRGFGRHT